MYEQKTINIANIKIFGIKLFEMERLDTEVFEREFVSDEDMQAPLGSYSSVTYKFLGIPVVKFNANSKPEDETTKSEPIMPKMNLSKNKILIAIITIFVMTICFILGIFTANSEWFNDLFYIKSQQMQNLEIKSLKPYNTALFKKAQTQYEMNMASGERYKHYHEYFEKVVDRIRNYNYDDDTVKSAIISYLDGYEQRKAKLDYVMFPCKNKPVEDCGYGTMLGSVYPTAMLEFDRQELLTYRMILTYMYSINPSGLELEELFEE